MGLKLASWGSVLTYAIFTVFPIIMFSIILVIKLKDNYVNEIDKLRLTLEKSNQKFNSCRSDINSREQTISHLTGVRGSCLDTLKHVSETMELLSSAFVAKHNMSQNLSFQLSESLKNVQNLNVDLSTQEDAMNKLRDENNELREKIRKLNVSLDNVNGDNQNLQSKLGIIQQDMDGLKSNTSRLLGENAGLEKVLNVKAELEDHKVEAAEKVLDLASKKGVKKIKIITEDEEDENSSNETIEGVSNEIEKVVEKNIKKMTKENKDELKPILEVLSNVAGPSTDSKLTQKNDSSEIIFRVNENVEDEDFDTKAKSSTETSQSLSNVPSVLIKEYEKKNASITGTAVLNKTKSNSNADSQQTLDSNKSHADGKMDLESATILENNSSNFRPKLNATTKLDFDTPSKKNNDNKLAEINMEMKNTKKAIRKLKRFGKILKQADVERKSREETGGGGNEMEASENDERGIINAKEASHQIAKIVKVLPNLVEV